MQEGKRQKAKGKRQKSGGCAQTVSLCANQADDLLSPSISSLVGEHPGATLKAKPHDSAAKWRRVLLLFAFCFLPFTFLPPAGLPVTFSCQTQNSVAPPPAASWSFNYKFENKRFYVPIMEIDLAMDGAGVLRFQRGESDDLLD